MLNFTKFVRRTGAVDMDGEWRHEGYRISTSRELLQPAVILDYLQNHSYWARDRTTEQLQTVIEHSLCFGMYCEKAGSQIGFARVVTDFATFAYLGDVFILPDYQGRGLGKWLLEVITGHPGLQGFRRWILATRDAHTLYRQYGFTELKHPARWMEKAAPNAY